MKPIFLFASLLAVFQGFTQQTIDVTEQTFKIGPMKTEELLFGFAAGDQVIFSFEESGGKDLKEIAIVEYPSTSRFSDYKISKIENKTLQVTANTVYKFIFHNNAVSGRICKVKIQRIPATEATKNYNTNVSWVTRQDTTWNSYTKEVIAGYDTTYEQKTKKEIIKTEQSEEMLLDKNQRVHSTINDKGPKTWVYFDLPQNEVSANKNRRVVAWAYWVGVGEEASEAWKQNVKAIGSLAKGVARYFTTPLGAFAVGAIVDLATPKLGEDVYYAITDETNKSLFMASQQFRIFDNGKGVAGYRKFTDNNMSQGRYFICMSNDNMMQGVNASVKVIAIVETNYYEDKIYSEQVITPRYEKKIFRDPVISTARVPQAG
ncbi:MAG: hypothetical protein ACXWCG_04010 [Flavitalea sp.]